MILLGCFATCAGSTGGGIKMMRMLLLLKQASASWCASCTRTSSTRWCMGRQVVDARVMQNVIAYMMIYGATLVVLTMLLLFSGLDVVTPSPRWSPASTTSAPAWASCCRLVPAGELRRADCRCLPDLGLHRFCGSHAAGAGWSCCPLLVLLHAAVLAAAACPARGGTVRRRCAHSIFSPNPLTRRSSTSAFAACDRAKAIVESAPSARRAEAEIGSRRIAADHVALREPRTRSARCWPFAIPGTPQQPPAEHGGANPRG
jgi:hypothetical protein